jgi:hypothetical protein
VVLTLTIGPILTSLVLISIIDGKNGLREFLSRLFRWRVSVRWYIIALLITPVFALVTLLALSSTSPLICPWHICIQRQSHTSSVCSFGRISRRFVGRARLDRFCYP